MSATALLTLGAFAQTSTDPIKISAMSCDPITTNYTQNFDDLGFFAPINYPCWMRAYGGSPATGYTEIDPDAEWKGRRFLNDSNNSMAATVRFQKTQLRNWLITPVFDLTSSTSYEVRFDYGLSEFLYSNPSTMGSDDILQFLISTDGGTTWTVAHTWDAQNSPPYATSTFVMDISSYTTNNVRFAFYASDGTVEDNLDNDFFIDNFSVTDTSSAATTNQEVTSLQVYPNPVSEVLTISNDEVISSIEIFDVNGRRLANKVVNTTSTTIDVSSYSSGTYFLKVIANGKTSIQQVIIK